MATSMPNKVVLKSTTKMSLHDRFSKIKPPATQNIRTQMAVTAESSAKNRRLAQQMSNRPTVQAALKLKKRSMQTRLGVKGRLGGGAPVQQFKGQQLRRVQSQPFRGQSRGQLRGRGRGRGRGFFPGRGVSRGFARGGLGGGQTFYNKSQGIFRSPATRGRAVSSPATRGRGVSSSVTRGRGVARGRGRGRGRGGRGGRGRGGNRTPASKGVLDNELDAYMSKTKGSLDADLDAYMADQS